MVHAADRDVVEEWKWMGTPVWCHDGNVCSADAHKNVVKMIFFHGAALKDPKGLFNAELEGTTRRAIKDCRQAPLRGFRSQQALPRTPTIA